MGQNTLSQSNFKIFESTISREIIDEILGFFTCWYKFPNNKSWLTIFCLGLIKNGYGKSGSRTLKLSLFQEWIGGINIFLHADTNSEKLEVASMRLIYPTLHLWLLNVGRPWQLYLFSGASCTYLETFIYFHLPTFLRILLWWEILFNRTLYATKSRGWSKEIFHNYP